MKKLLHLFSSISCFLLLVTCYLLLVSPVLAATSLSLTGPTEKLSINKSFSVTVSITSTDNTLGTDLVLAYDPDLLRFDSVTPGTIYPNYSKSDQTTAGKVTVSAVSDFTKGVTPNGTYATISFTPLKSGQTDISLAFDAQNPALSGVTPFEGDQANLLTQAPSPLALTITSSPLDQFTSATSSGIPLIAKIIIALVALGLIAFTISRRRQKPIAPDLPSAPPPPIATPPTPEPPTSPSPSTVSPTNESGTETQPPMPPFP